MKRKVDWFRVLVILALGAAVIWVFIILGKSPVGLVLGADRPVTIGIEQPTDGTRYALLCERIESTLLVVNGDVKWGGLPTYKSVKGSQRSETCPPSQGNWFAFQTEPLRNYHIYARLVRYDAEGNILSNRELPPYFWFDNGETVSPTNPRGPIILSV